MPRIELTKAEEQIMHIIWELKKVFVKDVIEKLPKPKPAYSTVSTIIRILVDKKAVGYKAYGKTHEYFPLIKKEAYSEQQVKSVIGRFFDDSPKKLLSFLLKEEKLDVNDLDEVMKLIEKNKK
jgi:predicted transcriptional regulator